MRARSTTAAAFITSRTAFETAADGSETCRYDVVNKDGQRHTGAVRVEQRLGRRIPVVIEFDRGMNWTLELRSVTRAETVASGAAPAAAAADADHEDDVATALLADD